MTLIALFDAFEQAFEIPIVGNAWMDERVSRAANLLACDATFLRSNAKRMIQQTSLPLLGLVIGRILMASEPLVITSHIFGHLQMRLEDWNRLIDIHSRIRIITERGLSFAK
jgi:hypothetical protein